MNNNYGGHSMKRQRGRNRRPGGGGGGGGGGHQHHNNNPNRTLESNGPDTKVRGPAAHIYERYLQLARDAASSGDRVLSENYMQHADHYFRMVRAMQPAQPVQQPQQDRFNDSEVEGDEEGASETERTDSEASAGEGGDQPDAEFAQGQPQQFDREGGGRRRGRRNRFRPEGGDGVEGGEERARGDGEERRESRGGGEERRERAPRGEGEERRERGPRRERSENESREGFSEGPQPAFLRGGGTGSGE